MHLLIGRNLCLLSFLLLGFSCGTAKLNTEKDFEILFNGKNLDAWVGNKQAYKVEDGVIVVDPKGGGSGGNLYTQNLFQWALY